MTEPPPLGEMIIVEPGHFPDGTNFCLQLAEIAAGIVLGRPDIDHVVLAEPGEASRVDLPFLPPAWPASGRSPRPTSDPVDHRRRRVLGPRGASWGKELVDRDRAELHATDDDRDGLPLAVRC